jgi:hypothetical protein
MLEHLCRQCRSAHVKRSKLRNGFLVVAPFLELLLTLAIHLALHRILDIEVSQTSLQTKQCIRCTYTQRMGAGASAASLSHEEQLEVYEVSLQLILHLLPLDSDSSWASDIAENGTCKC